jgi:hypothetical protein
VNIASPIGQKAADAALNLRSVMKSFLRNI